MVNDAPVQPVGRLAELVLTKRGQRWVFRYRRGEEPAVLRCIAQAAADPGRGLDWCDAAVLARQVGQRLCESIEEAP